MMIFLVALASLLAKTALTDNHALQCNSLPSFDNSDVYIYFGCTCESSNSVGGMFSISMFASNLTQRISDKSLVIDFRDCESVTVLMDQEQLYWKPSSLFRPDLSIVEINIDNIGQVNLHHGKVETSQNIDDYVLPKVLEQMVIHLYDVDSVNVEGDIPLDHLTTEQSKTELYINIADGEEGYHFSLEGFLEENIHLVIDKADLKERVFRKIGIWMLLESKTVSVMLVVSVLIVTLGIATMIIAIVKRHRLAIEAVVYGSIGSLKRLRKRTSTVRKKAEDGENDSNNNSNLTTATEVAFFPRYSVVNKSWREEGKEKKTRKSIQSNKDNNKEQRSESPTKYVDIKIHSQKQKGTNKVKSSPTKQSLYEIISTLRFKTEQVNNMTQKQEPNHQTSFYYQGNQSEGSSKYDLTLAKTLSKKIEVQVHQPDYESKESTEKKEESVENSNSSSPQPLLEKESESFYSFNTLREKCRKMIANSRQLPAGEASKTKL